MSLPKRMELKRLEVTARLRERSRQFVTNIRAMPDAAIFLKPVDTVLYRDYLDVVKKPMDLGYIGRRWRDRALWYEEFSEFAADMRLMIDNALLYSNRPVEDADVRGMTFRMAQIIETFIQEVYANPDKPAPRQPRSGEGGFDEDLQVEVQVDWVQCDRCNKWRRLPVGMSASTLPSRWTCADSTWDPTRASCDAPEDKDTDEQRPLHGPGSRGGRGGYKNRGRGRGRGGSSAGGMHSDSPGGDYYGEDGAGTPYGGEGEGGQAAGGKRGRGGRRSVIPRMDGERIADKLTPGTDEYAFWRGLERTWDEQNLYGNSRKAPLFLGRGLDLLELYCKVVAAGGYDAVNARMGGWTSIMRDLAGPSTPGDGNTAYRLKKVYEKQLLEYERRAGQGWTADSEPHPGALLTKDFTPPAAGSGMPDVAAPVGPVPVPSEGYKPPVSALGEGYVAAAGAGQGGEDGPASKRLKMFATTGAAGGWGTSENGRTALTGTVLDAAGQGVHFPAIRLPYEWRAPEAIPILTRPLLTSPLPEPSMPGGSAGDEREAGLGPSVYPAAASESDLNWAAERTAHILGASKYAVPVGGRGRGHRGHDKFCMYCKDTRKVMLPVGSAAAAAAGRAEPGAADDTDDDDEDMQLGDARAGAGGPASAAEGQGQGGEEDDEKEGGESGTGTGGAKKGWIRRRAAPFRAWALCSGCKNIACLPCLLPTPSAAGVGSEPERLKLLQVAADASCKRGSCTPTGKKLGISDVGLWFCPECVKSRKADGYSDVPFCSGCCGALEAPPTWQASMFELAALQRQPGAAQAPADWPTSMFKCESCGSRSHSLCAWRTGAASVSMTAVPPGVAAGSTGKARKGFLCGDCKLRLDPKDTGTVVLPPALSGLDRAAPSTAVGAGNGVVLVTMWHPASRATWAVGQLSSEAEKVPQAGSTTRLLALPAAGL